MPASGFGESKVSGGTDGRLDAPAFHRNHEPIWSVLGPFLQGKRGDVLEVGSGTGQHVVEFARRTPAITWQPSDVVADQMKSIAAWREASGLANIRPPRVINLTVPDWSSRVAEIRPGPWLAILCINVLQVSPRHASKFLLSGAAKLLQPGGRLFVYGPFKRGGQHTAQSNEAFDASLKRQDPAWGVRDMDDLAAQAERDGLRRAAAVAMPANNFVLAFERMP